MQNIITISRMYGSGGREIARLLAGRYHIPFYDKNVARISAAATGLNDRQAEDEAHHCPSAFSYRGFGLCRAPLADQIFFAQSQAIRQLAEQGPCIFVGRCADYVLRERTDCINIYLHSGLEQRTQRVACRRQCSESEARKAIVHYDRERAAYYGHYTRQRWGEACYYHLCLDTGMGINASVEIIAALLNQREQR